jgi:hypothetical protein
MDGIILCLKCHVFQFGFCTVFVWIGEGSRNNDNTSMKIIVSQFRDICMG